MRSEGPTTPQWQAVSQGALERLREHRDKAAKLSRLGYYGAAMREMESAIRQAPEAPIKVELLEAAAKIARRGGCFGEALELNDEAIALQVKMGDRFDASVFAIRGHRAEILLESRKFSEAMAAYAEIEEWSRSAHGTPVLGVLGNLGMASVLLAQGKESASGERLMVAAERFEEVVQPEALRGLAKVLQRGARMFSAQKNFLVAAELSALGSNYLQASGAVQGSPELNAAVLFEASIASKGGQHERAWDIQTGLLRQLEKKPDDDSAVCFALREHMATSAMHRGAFQDAERLLRLNSALAARSRGGVDSVRCCRLLESLYLLAGRRLSAARAALGAATGSALPSLVRKDAARALKGKVALGLSEGGLELSVGKRLVLISKEVRARVSEAKRLLRNGHQSASCHAQLNRAEELAGELPEALSAAAFEAIERVRGVAATTLDERRAAVEVSLKRYQEFEAKHGLSRELGRARRCRLHAKLLAAAGEFGEAGEWMERAHSVLQENSLAGSYPHALLLLDHADVLAVGDPRAEELRSEARGIIKDISRRDRNFLRPPGS